MIIALEGCDGSGKSTLFKSLMQLGIPVWGITRSTRVKSVPEMIEFLHMLQQVPPGINILLDRHPAISEEVYSSVLRPGKNLMDKIPPIDLAHYIDRIIYCRPSISRIYLNLTQTESRQMEGVVLNHEKIYTGYEIIMNNLRKKIHVIDYDYTDQIQRSEDYLKRLITLPKENLNVE